jgi:hypothetical protein
MSLSEILRSGIDTQSFDKRRLGNLEVGKRYEFGEAPAKTRLKIFSRLSGYGVSIWGSTETPATVTVLKTNEDGTVAVRWPSGYEQNLDLSLSSKFKILPSAPAPTLPTRDAEKK